MDRQKLQAVQAPIKAHLRDTPGAGLVTLRAEGALDPEEIACSVATGRALVEAGLHPAFPGGLDRDGILVRRVRGICERRRQCGQDQGH